MREQIKPVVRFLRWYCQPPDFVRAVTLQGTVAAPALLAAARAVVALAVLFAVLERVHVAPVLQDSLGVVMGLSATIAWAWRGARHGMGLHDNRTRHGQEPTAVEPRAVRHGRKRLAAIGHAPAARSVSLRRADDEGRAAHLHAAEVTEPALNVAAGSLTRGKES